VQRLYSLAVIPVNTGISDLWAMTGVANGAEIPALAGMADSYTAGICGVRNFSWNVESALAQIYSSRWQSLE
jgi:hypothetical protein